MIEIEGADQLARLAKQLKEAGAKDLQKELGKAINRATKPVKDDIKQSAEDMLPKRGGLAARAAKSPLRTRRRTGSKVAGVRIVSIDKTLSMYHLNQGQVRHPRKGVPASGWKVQHIEHGFWDKGGEQAAPAAREEIVQAMDDIARKVVRGV